MNSFLRHTKYLVLRQLKAVILDNTRIADSVVFPLTNLIVWGMLLMSDSMSLDVTGALLAINIVWANCSCMQMNINYPLVFDVWQNEFSEILKSGVSIKVYLFSSVVYGTLIGLGLLTLTIILARLLFGFSGELILRIVIVFPIFYLFSLASSVSVSGLIFLRGKYVSFVSWSITHIMVTFSSPFSEVASTPWLYRLIALFSPLTYVFSYLRSGAVVNIGYGLLTGVVWLLLSLAFYKHCYKNAFKRGKLVSY